MPRPGAGRARAQTHRERSARRRHSGCSKTSVQASVQDQLQPADNHMPFPRLLTAPASCWQSPPGRRSRGRASRTSPRAVPACSRSTATSSSSSTTAGGRSVAARASRRRPRRPELSRRPLSRRASRSTSRSRYRRAHPEESACRRSAGGSLRLQPGGGGPGQRRAATASSPAIVGVGVRGRGAGPRGQSRE